MGRCAQSQGAEQMPEERLSILRADPERFEHFFLKLRLVNSHASAANLDAVQNNVIRFRTNFGKPFLVEQR